VQTNIAIEYEADLWKSKLLWLFPVVLLPFSEILRSRSETTN